MPPKTSKAPADAHRRAAQPESPLFPEPTASIPRNTVPPEATHLPVMQWASGHTEARMSSNRFGSWVGWHSEVGKDEAFDAACAADEVPQIEIRHPRPAGSPAEMKKHWDFGEQLVFFPVTSGPPARTVSACVRQFARQTAEAGIGLSWPTGEKSRMAVRGYIVLGSTVVAVQLATKSTMTDVLLTALMQHITDCETADSLIDREKHPYIVVCHELAMILVAGTETAVGSEETSLITPFVAEPLEATREAALKRWRSRAVNEAAIADWDGIVSWAAGYASGATNGDSHIGEE